MDIVVIIDKLDESVSKSDNYCSFKVSSISLQVKEISFAEVSLELVVVGMVAQTHLIDDDVDNFIVDEIPLVTKVNLLFNNSFHKLDYFEVWC